MINPEFGGIQPVVPPPPGGGGGEAGRPRLTPDQLEAALLGTEASYTSYGVEPKAIGSENLGEVEEEIFWWLGDVTTTLPRVVPSRDTDFYTPNLVDKTILKKLRVARRERPEENKSEPTQKEKDLMRIRKEVGVVRNIWEAIAMYQDWRGDQAQIATNMFFAVPVAMIPNDHWETFFNLPGVNIDAAVRIYNANATRKFPPEAALDNDDLKRLMEKAAALPNVMTQEKFIEDDLSPLDKLAVEAASIEKLGGNEERAEMARSLAYWFYQMSGEAAWNDENYRGLPNTDDRIKFMQYLQKRTGDAVHPHGPDKGVSMLKNISLKYEGLDFISIPYLRWLTYKKNPESQDQLAQSTGDLQMPEIKTAYEGWWYEGTPLGKLPAWSQGEIYSWRTYLLQEGFFVGRQGKGVFDMTMQAEYKKEQMASIDSWRDIMKALNVSQHWQNLIAVSKYDSRLGEYLKAHKLKRLEQIENRDMESIVSKLKLDFIEVYQEGAIDLNAKSAVDTWTSNDLRKINDARLRAFQTGDLVRSPGDVAREVVKNMPLGMDARRLVGKK